LQRILFYRELGFGLDEITKILDDRTRTRSTTCYASTRC
jgi:DNA-binding transcriptional MerR regulator